VRAPALCGGHPGLVAPRSLRTPPPSMRRACAPGSSPCRPTRPLQDGQYKKTASNAKLRSHLPDYKFKPIREGIAEAVKFFVDNYETARK
jgi:hypothetical protein